MSDKLAALAEIDLSDPTVAQWWAGLSEEDKRELVRLASKGRRIEREIKERPQIE